MSKPTPIDPSGSSGALVPRGPVWTPRAEYTPPPVHAGNLLTMHFIWRSIARWWKLALPLGLLLGGSAGAGLWMTLKPVYRAEAWLKIEDHRPYIAFPGQLASQVFVKTQIELIRSPVVLGEILSQPEIAQLAEIKANEAPLEWLKDRLQVAALNGSELFQIKFEGSDPADAAKIVNAVMDSYLQLHSNEANEQTQRIIELLERQKEQRVRELERLQENVRAKTREATGQDPIFVNPNKEVYLAQSPVRALEEQLTRAEVEREVNTARLKALQESQADKIIEVPLAVVEQSVATDGAVRNLEQQRAKFQERIREYASKSKLKDADPQVQKDQLKIAEMDQSLEKLKGELTSRHAGELKKKLVAEREQQLAALQNRVEEQKMLEGLYRERLAAARKGLEKLGGHALDLEIARSEMAYAEQVRDKIAERVTMLQTERSAPTQVSPFRRATVPVQPSVTPFKKVALASLGGLTLPFALAVLWELRIRRISNVEQISNEISLPVVGEITTLPVRSVLPGKRSADRFERHRSTFEESIAYVRTSLLLSDDLRELQVLAVASAVSREGKSSLAAQLAVSLANATGETTLLIDTDMRDPDLHEMFDLPLEPGLAEVLEHQVTLDDAIVTSWSRRVHILPAGRLMRSPHVLLGGGAFHALLDEARARYRYIVIDSPPVLAASEALVVAKAADGTLLCTMRDISRVGQVRQATERLRTAGARPLGAVFSGVPPTNYAYKYGSYCNSPYARRTWADNAAAAEGGAEATDDEGSA